MYTYITLGGIANKLKPALINNNQEYKALLNFPVKEPMLGVFESDITPEEMLPYMKEANLIPCIIPIKQSVIDERKVRPTIMRNMAHLAYLSETGTLVIED